MSGNHQCFSSDLYKKCYFVKISQSKNRHIYSIVGKKTGRHIGKECQCFHRKINEIASSVFSWFCNQNDLMSQNSFLISNYQNKFLVIIFIISLSLTIHMSTSIFSCEEISTTYFCSDTFEVFSRLFNTDKRRFNFQYKFRAKSVLIEYEIFSSCNSCLAFVENLPQGVDFLKKFQCFIRYFIERDETELIKFE